MVEGRIRKFHEEVVLLKQAFVIDPENEREAGGRDRQGARLAGEGQGFVRFALGEGIEKEPDDFAAEVAAAHRPT